MERLQRDFFGDAADGAKKFHLVQGESVTSPKWRRGLDVENLEDFQESSSG